MENQQQGEGPDLVGLGLGVITPLCCVVRGVVGVGAAGVRVQRRGTG